MQLYNIFFFTNSAMRKEKNERCGSIYVCDVVSVDVWSWAHKT